MIAGAGEAVGGVLGFFLVLGLIVLAILAILMPYYVYKIRHLMQDLKGKADEQITETKRTNGLLRQVVRAYGHEPET
jgi:uncharacterized membrane protein